VRQREGSPFGKRACKQEPETTGRKDKASVSKIPSSEKKFLRALQGEVQDVPPIWFMRQAGRYLPEYRETRKDAGSFLDLCYSPDHAVEVTLQPIRRYGFDAAILFADILVIPDALGQPVRFEEGIGPVLEPVTTPAELAKLDGSKVREHLAPVFETLRGLSRELPEETALIGFAGAPWTVATYMVGGRGSPDQAAAKLWAFRAPDEFEVLIDMLVEATSDYLLGQIEAGAEAIQLFDTWAGSLPPSHFERWCVEPVRRIRARLQNEAPEVPVIAFPRGAGPKYPDYFKTTGVNAVSLDTGLSPEWARDNIQTLGPVQGNLDPLLVVAGGEEMRLAAARIIEALRGGPFIFNLGHGIVPQTPPEHVADLVDFIRSYR